MNFISKLFEGGYRHSYWRFLNLFGEPKDGCLCTMREECRTCWTQFEKQYGGK